jgi:hypothetical protein
MATQATAESTLNDAFGFPVLPPIGRRDGEGRFNAMKLTMASV